MQNYTTIMGVIRMREAHSSYDECQRRYQIGSSTCQLIMKRFKSIGLSFQDLQKMDEQKVVDAFYPPDQARRKKTPLPDYEKIYEALTAKGSKANLFYLWTAYKKEYPDGYQYTQFVEYFKRFAEKHYGLRKVSMAVERVPGQRVYIDWVGDEPEIIENPEDGTMQKAHVFVTTVGVSDYVYAEIFPDEKMTNFVAGTVHALEYYGAIPRYLVPDNASTAVTKHTKDQLMINSTYQDLENFYGTIVLPPPVYKPKGKPTVEKHVQYLETWLIEELRKNVYYSFEAANQACRQIIADINDRKIKGWEYTRKQAFEFYDKPNMKTLSDGSFTLCDYVAFNAVPPNYHLPYDGHYYSVLYTYYNKPVILKATMTEIRICDENNRLICTHPRSYKRFPKYITNDSDMPEEHRFYQEVNNKDGNY